MRTEGSEFPSTMEMSEKVTCKIGFADDRMVVTAQTGVPFLKTKDFVLTPDDLPKIKAVVEKWEKWMALPEEFRRSTGQK